VRRVLLALFPGAESWLWRRVSAVCSLFTLLYCIVVATHKGDAASIQALGITFGMVFTAYCGAAVADDHSKRQTGTKEEGGGC
jgi:succinate dehydrogenase hydrophobic anchor subunit